MARRGGSPKCTGPTRRGLPSRNPRETGLVHWRSRRCMGGSELPGRGAAAGCGRVCGRYSQAGALGNKHAHKACAYRHTIAYACAGISMRILESTGVGTRILGAGAGGANINAFGPGYVPVPWGCLVNIYYHTRFGWIGRSTLIGAREIAPK